MNLIENADAIRLSCSTLIYFTNNFAGWIIMGKPKNEKPALMIIDMVKDNFIESKKLPITPFALEIIDPMNHLISVFRKHLWPIVF